VKKGIMRRSEMGR
jgi:hypothetical protein